MYIKVLIPIVTMHTFVIMDTFVYPPSITMDTFVIIDDGWYKVAKAHRMPEVAGHFPQKSH